MEPAFHGGFDPAKARMLRRFFTQRKDATMDLPEGWVPLSQFDSKDRGRTDGHSPEYKVLAAAVRSGDVPGLQDAKSRRFYVPKDAAERFLIKRAVAHEDKREHDPAGASEQMGALLAVLSALVTNQTTTLTAVERIALALEKMADHPLARLEDVGILMPSREEQLNGFHQ